MASKYGKTPAQILLKYNIQRGLVVIPKSTNESRLRQNIELFDFTLVDEDMDLLAGLNENIRVCDFAFFKGSVWAFIFQLLGSLIHWDFFFLCVFFCLQN